MARERVERPDLGVGIAHARDSVGDDRVARSRRQSAGAADKPARPERHHHCELNQCLQDLCRAPSRCPGRRGFAASPTPFALPGATRKRRQRVVQLVLAVQRADQVDVGRADDRWRQPVTRSSGSIRRAFPQAKATRGARPARSFERGPQAGRRRARNPDTGRVPAGRGQSRRAPWTPTASRRSASLNEAEYFSSGRGTYALRPCPDRTADERSPAFALATGGRPRIGTCRRRWPACGSRSLKPTATVIDTGANRLSSFALGAAAADLAGAPDWK